MHSAVARSTFRSQNVRDITYSDHFWRLSWIVISLATTTAFEIKNYICNILQHTTTTQHYTTLHYNWLQLQLQLRLPVQLQLQPHLHFNYNYSYNCNYNYTALDYNILELHYTTLDYPGLHCTPLHYKNYNYNYTIEATTATTTTTRTTTTPQLQLQLLLQLHYTRLQLHYTTLDYRAWHCTALRYTTLH